MQGAIRAFNNFIGEPVRYRHFGLAWFRLAQLMHERTNGAYDNAYMKAARMIRRKVAPPPLTAMSTEAYARCLDQLRRDGYAELPFRLTADDIRAITDMAFSTPAHGRDYGKDIRITRDAIPRDEPRYYWRTRDLVALPEIQRLVCEGPFCTLAQDYLECRPLLTGITLFLDPPYQGRYEPHQYHYDNDGPGFLKFFIYITDAQLGTGAHYFLAGTHSHAKPPRFAKAAIYPEEALFEHFGRDREVVATASAGTIIAEDTAGFHRGSTITRDYRLLMQLQFSVLDIPDPSELGRAFTPAVVPGLDPGTARIVRKYFTARA